ncbi:MAG: hypothetical protein R3234_06475 [Thermoanaerobaculia bacterium]|nr:hypothetical protein [Thermoanaerobaculia bacterium]
MATDPMKEGEYFLPEEEWGEVDLESSSSPWWVLANGVLGVVACGLMVVGGGGPWTWWGALLFLATLLSFTVAAFRGIEAQNRAVEEILEEEPRR